MKRPNHILAIIVIAQFCCTSVWFAGNGVMDNLISNFNLNESAIGHLTSAIQFGFIVGTLIFAIFSLPDRYSPSRVFFSSALAASLFNILIITPNNTLHSLLLLRVLSGIFLAGIYPVGMKIAADYFNKGLGKSLGLLVGALVLGTAFPHLLKGFSDSIPWHFVIILTSGLAILGGTSMLILVPDGPYRTVAQKLDFSATYRVFKNRAFRSAAFGYFGHMWELYAFWAFIPTILTTYIKLHSSVQFNVPLISFLIIGVGGLSCVLGGFISQRIGTKKTAFAALSLSCLCCMFSPFFFNTGSYVFIAFLLFWGMLVVADSPLFSTLVAQNSVPNIKGTALTIVNGIGFLITIISIQLLTFLFIKTNSIYIYTLLSIGPIFGLISVLRKPH